MNFELERWDRFITHELVPGALKAGDVQVMSERSKGFRDALRQQITEHVFSLSKQKAAELFIQHQQAVLIRLLDTVHDYIQRKCTSPEQRLYKEVSDHLRFVLEFIENYFSKYFNLDEKVPAYYLQVSKSQICAVLQDCRRALENKGASEGPLLEIIFDAFKHFCETGERDYTYRELIYLKELLGELGSLGSLHKEGCIYAALTELMIYMNFNSPAFFNYVLAFIHESLKQIERNEQRVEKLARHRKEIAQMQLKPGFALMSDAPSVQILLIEAIDKEIEYLTAINGSGGAEGHVQEPATAYGDASKQIYVPFKGAEIYLLHKAFIDAGGAPGEIYKTLLERVAPYLSNKTQKGFSAESLCKYSDKVTPAVKDDVRRFLMKMVRNIESYD